MAVFTTAEGPRAPRVRRGDAADCDVSPRTPTTDRRGSRRAIWVHRLATLAILVIVVLACIPAADLLDQLPDVQRQWADGLTGGVLPGPRRRPSWRRPRSRSCWGAVEPGSPCRPARSACGDGAAESRSTPRRPGSLRRRPRRGRRSGRRLARRCGVHRASTADVRRDARRDGLVADPRRWRHPWVNAHPGAAAHGSGPSTRELDRRRQPRPSSYSSRADRRRALLRRAVRARRTPSACPTRRMGWYVVPLGGVVDARPCAAPALAGTRDLAEVRPSIRTSARRRRPRATPSTIVDARGRVESWSLASLRAPACSRPCSGRRRSRGPRRRGRDPAGDQRWVAVFGAFTLIVQSRELIAPFRWLRLKASPVLTLGILLPFAVNLDRLVARARSRRCTRAGLESANGDDRPRRSDAARRPPRCELQDDERLRDQTSDGAPQVRPVYLIAAEGGGIRAAYWTASALATSRDAQRDRASSRAGSAAARWGSPSRARSMTSRRRAAAPPKGSTPPQAAGGEDRRSGEAGRRAGCGLDGGARAGGRRRVRGGTGCTCPRTSPTTTAPTTRVAVARPRGAGRGALGGRGAGPSIAFSTRSIR